jgi:GMP synthase-like glutamine amidotransferase
LPGFGQGLINGSDAWFGHSRRLRVHACRSHRASGKRDDDQALMENPSKRRRVPVAQATRNTRSSRHGLNIAPARCYRSGPMNPVRIFRHITCETPGYLGELLERCGCPYEVVCVDQGVEMPRDLDGVAGLVFMGGPGNVNEPPEWMLEELALIRAAADRGIPVLGICLGAQMISKAYGGTVMPAATLEVGWHTVEWLEDSKPAQRWFGGLPRHFEVFQWHAHTWSPPPGAVVLARSACVEQQAFAIDNCLALQFHLEITPDSIRGIVEKYPGDLEPVSDCVQGAAALLADLEARSRKLHRVAKVVFGRWLKRCMAP